MKSCGRITSIEHVERLLEEPAPRFSYLLDALSVAKREGRDDLRDRCIHYAMAAVNGEVPEPEIRHLAHEAAVRLMETASFSTLSEDVARASRRMNELSRTSGQRIPAAMEREQERLDHIVLCLARATAPSFTSAAGRFRTLERPDLAYDLCIKAAKLDSRSAAALISMAAALIDMGRVEEGRARAEEGEQTEPSHFSSSVLSRVHRVLADYPGAIKWAEETVKRAPDQPVGYRVLAAAAYVAGDHDRLKRARQQLEKYGGRSAGGKYSHFLMAVELLKTERDRGLGVLRELAESGYPPATRKLLEMKPGAVVDRG